jgi:hypothetical protein
MRPNWWPWSAHVMTVDRVQFKDELAAAKAALLARGNPPFP